MRPGGPPETLGLKMTKVSEMFSGSLRVCGLTSLSVSLWRWQVAPGRERTKASSATRRGKDREGNGVDGLSLRLVPEPESAPNPALEQDEAEAALLPPAAHLIMVVCCVED